MSSHKILDHIVHHAFHYIYLYVYEKPLHVAHVHIHLMSNEVYSTFCHDIGMLYLNMTTIDLLNLPHIT